MWCNIIREIAYNLSSSFKNANPYYFISFYSFNHTTVNKTLINTYNEKVSDKYRILFSNDEHKMHSVCKINTVHV